MANNPTITEKTVLMEVAKKDGTVERQFPITKIENVVGAKKLIQEGSTKQLAALRLLASNPYLIDDTTGDIYKIGVDNGEFYFVPVETGIAEILDEIGSVIEDASSSEE